MPAFLLTSAQTVITNGRADQNPFDALAPSGFARFSLELMQYMPLLMLVQTVLLFLILIVLFLRRGGGGVEEVRFAPQRHLADAAFE